MKDDGQQYGAKAQSLLRLQQQGFAVPSFIVLPSNKGLLNDEFIQAQCTSLNGEHFAVRSSANLEDGSENSFAGLFATELFVPRKGLLNAVKSVYQSVKSERVQVYCKQRNIDPSQIRMYIIIQEMITADVSGVAFGLDPTKLYKKQQLINAVWGLGEGLVSGRLNADEYAIQANGNIRERLTSKNEQLIFKEEQLDYVPVMQDMQEKATLSHRQLNEISGVLKKLDTYFGAPQDIEFCYLREQFYLLQSRPITALKKEHIIWDNSNIVESYPGISSPFTFSFIVKLYEAVYKNFVGLLGVPQKEIEQNKQVFAQMLGHIQGRVYYQLIHWYQALALLPAYQLNASYMEKMMGVSEPLGVVVPQPNRSKGYNYLLLIKMIFKSLSINRKLPRLKKEFSARVQAHIAVYKNKNYAVNTDQELWHDFNQFKNVLVNDWFPPLANDLYAMIYYGVFQSLCKKWLHDESAANKWIVGRHVVKSAQPALLVDAIIGKLDEEDLLTSFKNQSAATIWQQIQEDQLGVSGNLIQDYITQYGDRSVGELKIENETYAQNPLAFIEVLQSYQSVPVSRERPPIFKPDLKKLNWAKRKVIKYVAAKSAEMIADRENLRFDRTLAFGMGRRFMNLLADRWMAQGILTEKENIFYLTEEDIGAFLESEISVDDVKEVISKRKKTFAAYELEDALPERIHQWGGYLDIEKDVTEDFDNKISWQGVACCAGEIQGRIRVVKNPSEVRSLEGDILVCTSTDPGWISIFRSASGILVERGSALSHAAIVCREMGIPCVVGLKGISHALQTGNEVIMNGSTGVVQKI